MKRKRIVLAAVAVVVVVAGGGVAVTALAAPDKGVTQQNSGLPPATAPIERGDLSDSTQKQGTLGYSKERKINAGAMGTITWVAGAGSSVARDGRLYGVDGKPVRLMYGTTPMYRTLKTGDKGDDVRQLKENLRALGFGSGLAADGTFTAGTADAVKRWQKDHDLPRTGTTGPDQIAFSAGPVRIKSADSTVGDQAGPGKPVLTTTSSERIVEFKLEVADGQLARTGTKVTVDLPGGGTAQGKVSSIGKTVEEGEDPQDKTPRISVTVTFDDPSKVGGLDKSPVTVNLTGQTHQGVLSVPVNALLALPSGGFGVQVVENGKARDVAVELGMFGQGRVEISGGGLREGMKVGVPSL
ncbi:peptidoglycan-binding protein [Streptomyces sp. DSM 41987]|uniref:peptidoglycan-binding protein n=1 Tax=Streptomyces TaxID=1883 RepID=UPI0018E056F9|nr:peptidoglycan-binding protein [Streptomyces fildesensis]